MSETILKIEGMSCMHCKAAVERALQELPGVIKAEVDLEKKEAVVDGPADRDVLVKAVDEAGYKVVG